MSRVKFLSIALLLVFTSSCGYLNSFYNAQRQFKDAERSAARGDRSAATVGYNGALEKAAKSYRKYPRGRWSDDALHLIARSRFELGEYAAARAAALELLTFSNDATMRGDAHAIAGASAFELRDASVALIHLDSATTNVSDRFRGRAHLWRARAYRELGDVARAWQDLDAVGESDASFTDVQLERIAFGIEQRDSARVTEAFAKILEHRDSRRILDTVADLALHAVSRFGAASTRNMLNATLPDWLASARDSIALVRADLALRAGDTVTATTELTQLAGRSTAGIANAARIKLANAQVRQVSTLEELRDLRATLLPAIAVPAVPPMLRNMRIVDALVQKAQTSGQAVALFAAAEIARDDVGAPLLARRLFVTFVDVAPQTPWSPKALLAAIALDPDASDANELRARLTRYTASPYLQATDTGASAEAYEVAEERLQRSLLALRQEGAVLADQQDLAVGRVVATLDSMRVVARTDSARIRCGLMIDTLAIGGARADSVRSACMRSDTLKLAEYLAVDTMIWRATNAVDSVAATRRRVNTPRRDAKRDTTVIR